MIKLIILILLTTQNCPPNITSGGNCGGNCPSTTIEAVNSMGESTFISCPSPGNSGINCNNFLNDYEYFILGDCLYNSTGELEIALSTSYIKTDLIYQDGVVVVSWVNYGIYDINYYIIESSTGGKVWTEVGRKIEKGDTIYQVKSKPTATTMYYKVVMVDFDGIKFESDISSIKIEPAPTLVKITDLLGREVSDRCGGILLYHYSDGTVIKIAK